MKAIFNLLLIYFLTAAPLTIAAGTSWGTGSSKTSSNNASCSQPFTPPCVIVVMVAFDNIITTDGDGGNVTVTDDAGNTYTKASEFTNGQGGAGSGAACGIYYKVLTTGTTVNITATFSANITAKAIRSGYFTITSGNLVAVQSTGTLANDGADAGAITLSSLPSREYLFVRNTAAEMAQTATAVAASTNFTPFSNISTVQVGTTGGGATTNMVCQAEYRIVTGTTQASDPTTTAVDCASTFAALYEFTPSSLPRKVIILNK